MSGDSHNKHLERAKELAIVICEYTPDEQNQMVHTLLQVILNKREEMVEKAQKELAHLVNSLTILKNKAQI